ncbi:MAG: fumarylacetoacetate hydrolase family protein [Gammaproteobacteria bacterium]
MSFECPVGQVVLGADLGGGTAQVGKIVCVGRNYVAHIEELGNEMPDSMVLFSKPRTAIASRLTARHDDEALHYEGEICFMVREGRLFAVAFGLDLTKRDLQSRLKAKGLPWERAKAFDGAALFSPFVTFPGDTRELGLELDIDGRPTQRGDTGLMIHKPMAVFAEISAFMTLEDGDIVMTGTPSGVGEVRVGARFEGRIVGGERVLTEGRWTAV